MSIDVKIKNAIEVSVEKSGQPPTVANRLVAWFEAVNDSNEDINDLPQVERRLEGLYMGTVPKSSGPFDDREFFSNTDPD